jgi:predicted flap endonuclease-1-like 5' DNA nuclease
LSFVIGFAVNLILAFLGGLLALTICLLPIALVPMLALLAINLLGWAVLAQLVGNRFELYVQRPMESWMSAAVGAVIITSVFALLWAFGGFFRFLGNGILLFTASFGAGAVLLPWVMRVLEPAKRTGTANQTSAAQQSAAQSSAATPPPASVTPAPAGGFESPELTATSAAGTTPTPTTPIATGTEETGTASLQESIEERLAATSEESIDTAPPDLDVSDIDGEATSDVGAEQEDDFTELKGVGPVLDGRLKDAGIRTFRQLANLTTAEVAEIVGWSEARVASIEIVEQARHAAS